MSLSLGNDKIQNNQHFEEGWNLVVPAWNQLVAPWNWVVPTWGGFCQSSTYKRPTEKILSDSNPRYHSWILGKPKLWTFDTWHPDLTTQEFQGGTKEFQARTRRFQGGTKEFRVEPGGWSPGFPILGIGLPILLTRKLGTIELGTWSGLVWILFRLVWLSFCLTVMYPGGRMPHK